MLENDENVPLAESTWHLTTFRMLLKIARKTVHYNVLI